MIREGKVAIVFFIAYMLLVLTIFRDLKRVTYSWDFGTKVAILCSSLSATWLVAHSSIAKRAAAIGKPQVAPSLFGSFFG